MAAYLQLGDKSWNLLSENDIGNYVGAIINPINDSPNVVADRIAELGQRRAELELILDPHLYNPSVMRGKLPAWSYYPADFETANRGDLAWWRQCSERLVQSARVLGLDAVCSPAVLAKSFNNDYYDFLATVAEYSRNLAVNHGLGHLTTVIVKLDDMTNPDRAYEIASILTRQGVDRIYLLILSELQPRVPFSDVDALATTIHLIRMLSEHMRIHVAFCGHDLILWKYAGAQELSSGKFFNLRRFVPGRWEDSESKGRPIPYWSDGELITLLRDQDVLTLDKRHGWFDTSNFEDNPFSKQILERLRGGSGQAWLGLAWRQYLRWVANEDFRLSSAGRARETLLKADQRWHELDNAEVLLADRVNDGAWIRYWLNACAVSKKR